MSEFTLCVCIWCSEVQCRCCGPGVLCCGRESAYRSNQKQLNRRASHGFTLHIL